MAASQQWEWPASRREQFRYTHSLRPTKEQITANRSALGKIVHVCHQQTGLDIDRVTSCGSVGKKTDSALCSDLDLVVYVNNLDAKDLKHQVPKILDTIQAALDKQYPGTRDEDWYRKFGLRYNIKGLEIDILVGSRNIAPKDFLEVDDEEDRAYMSASVSHLNKRFIAKQNLLFKDLVRVVKHWRDSFPSWPQGCKPKSYLLELIMLHVFWKFRLCGKTRGQTFYPYPVWWTDRLLQEFFSIVGSVPSYNGQHYDHNNLPELFVCFEPYYTQSELSLGQLEPIFAQTKKTRRKRTTKYAMAVVLDPVNPTNNVWLTLADSGTMFVDRARTTHKELSERTAA